MFSRDIQNLMPKYSILKEVHQGISSAIYLVQDSSGIEYALKLYNKIMDADHFENELKIYSLLCNVGNQDFIRYISSSKEDKNSNVNYIVLELAEKGSLDNFILSQKHFDEKMTKIMAWKIAHIVEKLHKLCFSHRDLNTHNILVDQNYNLKLGGFGSVEYFLSQSGKSCLLKDKINSPNFIAPEASKQPYDGHKVDIFGLGVLLLYMRTGYDIFTVHKNNIYKIIKGHKFEHFWKIIELNNTHLNLTSEFKKLINSMLEYNYKKRPDISYVINHPWFDEIRFLTYDEFQAYENYFRKSLKEIEEAIPQKEYI